MINIGAYKRGSNASIDYAIEKIEAVNQFLMQEVDEKVGMEETLELLQRLFEE